MIRIFSAIALLLTSLQLTANQGSFTSIDNRAAAIGYYPLDILAKKLIAPYKSDDEKVRSIFYWITQHIDYDVAEYKHPLFEYKEIIYRSTADSLRQMKMQKKEYAEAVINKRMGICEGYALLFKLLCEQANIKAEVIRGCARSGIDMIGEPVKENHAWNAVWLNGKWRLLDACWATGTMEGDNTTFTRKYNEYYYLTPPELFMLNHYPTDSSWILARQPATPGDFSNFPHICFDKTNRRIAGFEPEKGTVQANVGDSVIFSLNLGTAEIKEEKRTCRVIELDSAGHFIVRPKELNIQKSTTVINDKNVRYTYHAWSKDVTALYLEYKGVYMLAYKAVIK